MALLLHAIVPAETVALDAPFLSRVEGGAVVGFGGSDDVDAQEHHRRVSLLHEHFSACLPARYGSRFQDAEALRAVLTQKQNQLTETLERVRGRSELAVTATWASQPTVEAATPGRRYLLERQRRHRVARAVVEAVTRQARAKATAVSQSRSAHKTVAASVAVLVPTAGAEELAQQLREIEVPDGVRILVSGPWPPYSFVGLDQREE